jgi:hypothetical protein
MSSTAATSVLHLLRVRTPSGDHLEADHDGYADYAAACRGARALASELAGEGGEFGRSEVAADLCDTLEALGADPLACAVEVVARCAPGRMTPHGWASVNGFRVMDFVPRDLVTTS